MKSRLECYIEMFAFYVIWFVIFTIKNMGLNVKKKKYLKKWKIYFEITNVKISYDIQSLQNFVTKYGYSYIPSTQNANC